MSYLTLEYLGDWVNRAKRLEKVERLFSPEPVHLTGDDVAHYRSLGNFALASDRQSIAKESRRKDATGQKRRIDGILTYAELLRVALPVPVERKNRQEGQLAYHFEGFLHQWFVDGLKRDASGYTADPRVRPELWRMLQTAEILATQYDCPPHAIIFGELTRFFREPFWIEEFCKKFWCYGVRVVAYGVGEITPQNLFLVREMVRLQSNWLPTVLQGWRRARKEQNRLTHSRPPAGFVFVESDGDDMGTQVWTEPCVWNGMREAIHLLVTRQLPSAQAAVEWLLDNIGLKRSDQWFIEWVRSKWGEGIYPCYNSELTPIYREDISSGATDPKLTESGNRVYHIRMVPGIEKLVHYSPGTEPIPRSELEQVRSLIAKRGKHPSEDWKPRDSILIGVKVVCARCGSGVIEVPAYRDRRFDEHRRDMFSHAQDRVVIEMRGHPMHEQITSLERVTRQEWGEAITVTKHRISARRWFLNKKLDLTGDLEADLVKLREWWLDPFVLRQGVPRVRCRVVDTVASRESRTYANIRHLIDHRYIRNGELGNPVFQAIWEKLLTETLPARTTRHCDTRLVDAQRELDAAQADYDRFVRAVQAGSYGDPTDPFDAQQIARQRKPLAGRFRAAQESFETLTEKGILDRVRRDDSERLQNELRVLMEQRPEVWSDRRMRAVFLRRYVDHIVVDLEAGTFVAHLRIDQKGVREIPGVLGLGALVQADP